ncbi:DEAD/DEAH box helicase [Pleionea sp. CnH1-48]|uniref:DEAD/DEAH box helicase n=1 Tax=Pleionea sp. CnH1-48 TaxID=2954494 RepID=UPI002097EC9C|nr:DEAD/DEAH box helicase [Pleionea sp. CnH1-48]MCO7224188.1 DEAD/DEAH box helicase [Pleionea sp. CnH1-48]
MLSRPLAFKGPTDHLSRHFDESVLFRGISLLLQNRLSDWKYIPDMQSVVGSFYHGSQRVEAALGWPQLPDNEACGCSEIACEHLAALAIESKTRLHQLPYPLREAQETQTAWYYLKQWLKLQSHDPYPNMARHRLVYLLDEYEGRWRISVHKAYLTKADDYQLKATFDVKTINKGKSPKFVSQVDQTILKTLLTHLPEAYLKSSEVLYQFPLEDGGAEKLLSWLLKSGRCFWKSCYHAALHSTQSTVEPTTSQKVVGNYYLERSQNLVIEHIEALSPTVEFSSSDPEVVAFLAIESHSLSINDQPIELDVARVRFLVEGQSYSLQSFINHPDSFSNNTLERVAMAVRRIETLSTLKSAYEAPVWSRFDIGDRVLEGDFGVVATLLRGLQLEGWQIHFDSSYRQNAMKVEQWYANVISDDEASVQNWFELELGVQVDGQSFNLMPDLVRAIRSGQLDLSRLNELDDHSDFLLTLENQQRVLLPVERLRQICSTLIELFEQKPLSEQQRLRLHHTQVARLTELSEDEDSFLWQGATWLKEKADAMANSQGIQRVSVPDNLAATLRDYQQDGLNWLQFIRHHGLSGILADDMGLGKTLQTLTHILVEKNSGRMQSPCLVVAPTSLQANWQAEANKFAPSLNILHLAGHQRSRWYRQLEEFDVVITSYGLLLRDIQKIRQQSFHLVVLDEAQAIKNSKAKVAKAAYALKAEHRLCLTGTPMENHLGELWSLFHFLMPGFLGDETQFRRLYRHPIEKENDRQRQQALTRRIGPLMLRRTKTKVATELPAKTEIHETIEMEETQADLYEAIRLSMAEEVRKVIANQGASRNHLMLSNALLKLRQVCCHPSLVKLESAQSVAESAKMNWLQTVLPEMVEEGRRVLIFSQFTTMLELIGDALKSWKIDYLQLTGQTRQRGKVVDAFQEGQAPVFLISLKAGGSGLNLTAADTVIHFDPWWNPAAEQQASDRAYRIGQDKPVFVYKLITKGTVEERIQWMQQHKQALADTLYDDTQGESQGMQADDWMALFEPIEEETEAF